jgi:hypothetical protein
MTLHKPSLTFRGLANLTLALIFSVALLSSCATRQIRADRVIEVKTTSSCPVRIVYQDSNKMDARLVANAVAKAMQRLRQWTTLREPVTVIIYPTHTALEIAVRRGGYSWLRAWAQYDRIHLQAPGTWGGSNIPNRVEELLTHEFVHVLMYQAIGDRNTWKTRTVPFWFREGLASVASNQGYMRLSLDKIRSNLKALPVDTNPIAESESLARNHANLVYSIGHHMMEDLFSRCGMPGTHEILAGIANGLNFEQSFAGSCSIVYEDFLSEWRTRLGMVGWCGN